MWCYIINFIWKGVIIKICFITSSGTCIGNHERERKRNKNPTLALRQILSAFVSNPPQNGWMKLVIIFFLKPEEAFQNVCLCASKRTFWKSLVLSNSGQMVMGSSLPNEIGVSNKYIVLHLFKGQHFWRELFFYFLSQSVAAKRPQVLAFSFYFCNCLFF